MAYESTYNKLPDPRIHVYFDPKYEDEAIKFIKFLRDVGKKHGLSLYYRNRSDGHIQIIVDRKQTGHLDTLLQELILSRGLYYYVCTLSKSTRDRIVDGVIIPIYQDLLEQRFHSPYSKHIKQHILARISPNEFVPGDMENEFSKECEVLYRKWTLGLIDNSGYIEDLDSLMMRFLLTQIGHKPGDKSPQFDVVLSQANKLGIGMDRDFRKLFQKVHKYRSHVLSSRNKINPTLLIL